MSPRTLPRYKRRKALAIRRFPLGCGPNAVRLNPKHIVQTSSPGRLENVRVATRHFPDGCGPNAVKFEDPKLREEIYSPAGLENGKVCIVDELCVLCSEAPVSPEIAELQNSLMPIPLENNAGVFSAVEIQSALCSEGSFSSVRQGPPHSLMSVAVENNAGASNVVEDVCMLCSSGSLSSEKEVLPNSLIPAGLENNVAAKPENTKLEVSELVKHSSYPPKLQDGYSYLKVHEPPKWRKASAIRQFPHRCESNGGCISKNGHQKPALQQREKREGSAWIASNTNVLRVVENMPLVKRPIVIDGSAGIVNTENIHENSMVNKATTTDFLAMVASVEKVAGYNRRDSIVAEGKAISIDRSILVRSNSDKNFEVEDTIGHVQIKTSVMSGSDGTLKHTSSGKMLQQQEKEEGSALVASTNILHAMEDMLLVKQPIVIDGPAGITDTENTLKHENSNVNQAKRMDDFVKVASIEKVVVYNRKDSNVTKGKEENIDRNILAKSNSDKNFGVDSTSGHIQINSTANNGSYGSLIRSSSDKTLKQQEKEEGFALVASTKTMLHVVENMPFLKEPMVIDGSAGISDTENTLNHESSMNQAIITDGLANLAYVPNVAAYNTKDYQVTKGEVKSIDRNILVRSNTDKNLSVVGTSGHLQFKYSVMSGPDGTLKRSSSDEKLEVCKSDKAVENLQIKAHASCSTHLVVESQIGSEPANKEFSPLVEKPSVKNNEISKKRKSTAEIYYKEPTSYVKDGASVAFGERMVILALMAPENCPWRKSKRQGATTPKMMKEKKLMNKNYALNEFSSSQQMNKGFIEEDDYLVEEKNRKCLTLCEKPNELSITMTPDAPPKMSQKGCDDGEVVARHKVKRALRLFQLICRKLLQGEESNSKLGKVLRIDLQASGILKENGEWVNSGDPIIGHVPGVEIGDEFHYRVELAMVGLHRPYQGGIDCTKKNGLLVATSIVAADGYQDGMDSSDVLIYCGSGGTSLGPDKQPVDQKLERGNLALRNSIDAHTPVRVIHGFKEKGSDPHDAKGRLVSSFTYDGLYDVEKYWQARGPHGFNVFKFQLRRKAGQPELALKELKRSAKLKIRQGLCVKDISMGMEKISLSVVNTIDTEQPMPFNYITKNIYPSWYVKTPPRGCDCTNGCSDSEKCACAVKNGGEIPYNFNGAIVQAKPLIYECGPSCKCRPSCHNRVSQHGIRMQLEIFKTGERGWGLRSLKSISSGSFICEYMGELLQDGEAEMRDNDEYLFDIGHNYDDHSLWDGLPNHIPELQLSSVCDTVENVGYTIDAANYGNIGRFINHSCSPNLYAQNVLYDHDDKRMPHIMLFAVDNIPPLQELTYHYNYTIDQVRDSEGNIKQKACYCGSPECCGRLY